MRLYNPATGRFLQVDSIYGGSCNSYEYVCGDPVNNVDLDGMAGCPVFACSTWQTIAVIFGYVADALGFVPGWLCGPCAGISVGFGALSALGYWLSGDRKKAEHQIVSTVIGVIVGKFSGMMLKGLVNSRGATLLYRVQHSKVTKFIPSNVRVRTENWLTAITGSLGAILSSVL